MITSILYKNSYTTLASVPAQSINHKVTFLEGETYVLNIFAITLNGRVSEKNHIACSRNDQVTVDVFWQIIKGEHTFSKVCLPLICLDPPITTSLKDRLFKERLDAPALILEENRGTLLPSGEKLYPFIDPRTNHFHGDNTSILKWDASTPLVSKDKAFQASDQESCLANIVFHSTINFFTPYKIESGVYAYSLTHDRISTGPSNFTHRINLSQTDKLADFTIEVVNPKSKL